MGTLFVKILASTYFRDGSMRLFEKISSTIGDIIFAHFSYPPEAYAYYYNIAIILSQLFTLAEISE